MKRIVFRISILGMVVALGLLAIAHAQRTVPDAPPDDGPSNPLRDGQPHRGGEGPANYRADAVGPVDTDVPPRENPLRTAVPGATATCNRCPAKSRNIRRRHEFVSWPRRARRRQCRKPGQLMRVSGSNPNSCRQRPTAMPFPRGRRNTRIRCSRRSNRRPGEQ